MNYIRLNGKVLVDELGRVCVVCVNSAYLGSSEIDLINRMGFEELAYGLFITKVQRCSLSSVCSRLGKFRSR